MLPRHISLSSFLASVVGVGIFASSAAADDGEKLRIRPVHNLLEGSADDALSIGDRIASLRFRDVSGEAHRWGGEAADAVSKAAGAAEPAGVAQQAGPKATAFVFLSTTCPLAKRYVERLKRLAKKYEGKVAFFGVFPNEDETPDGVQAYAKRAGYEFPLVLDPAAYLVGAFGATMTPHAMVVDAQGRLRYRGGIDDNRYEDRVKERWLADALAAVSEGRAVAKASTRALGCTIHAEADPLDVEPGEKAGKTRVTYARHVARILQDNCQSCHREGEVGPFALTGYKEARRWAKEIKAYTRKRLMPPWKAEPGFGAFLNDMSLSDREIETIARWVDGGAPKGDSSEIPPAPVFPEGWAFGEPDLVVGMPEEYTVGPEGEDDYRHFVIPYDHGEPRFVEALDVRPGNRSTVHHVIAYVDTSGKARELDAADPGPGYSRFGGTGFEAAAMIGGWAPGNFPKKTPAGTGVWLPPKGDFVLQVHYYRTGVEERDQTKIGLWFSEHPRPVPLRIGMAIDTEFRIPPGDKRFEVRARRKIKRSVYLVNVTPHMHLIGRDMKVIARRPNGEEIPLVSIPDWDFNWQTTYRLRDMPLLPAGSSVELVAHFDNSEDNPHNPFDPPRELRFGEGTTDEMCIAFFSFLRAKDYDPEIGGPRRSAD